ncbi:MAG: response regulator transcription factor [Merismopedia sp. SIO2A8]|nr:response regulator transcription factor [Symploca sp. SIO2B6]NET48930.1 response regulator transcription factor [Merismopedia sp. SIO2A8]
MANDKKRILVVDDEHAIRQILATRLSMGGYEVSVAANGEEALKVFEEVLPDLVVLDVMMPKLDGLAVCRELRKSSDVPIIMLTALGEIADRITGLEMGADDYIAKPFSPKELEARIKAILRRVDHRHGVKPSSEMQGPGVLQAGALRIELNKRQVYADGKRIRLTGIEFDLLQLLVSRPGESVPRAEILNEVWGYTPSRHTDLRVVDVHISRLRAKLEDDPGNPEFIHTDRGRGYFFPRFSPTQESVRA